ncbi:MAG TPA: sulfite exporter TauE/SafE family protein [Candidatus Manganitrophaceae bacterium]
MTEALLLFLVGGIAGLLAGLLGIGGGIVLVPALIFLFESLSVPREILTHLAVGTSLASIIFTGAASAWAHHRRKNVDWSIVWGMAPFIVIGAPIGALLAGALEGGDLKRLFGCFELLIAARMLLSWEGAPGAGRVSKRLLYPAGGLAIGIVSSLFGIGGGTLTVPLIVTLMGRPIKTAVGTSSAQGAVIAIFGAIGFVHQGWGRPSLPPGAWGYVSIPAALLIAAASTAAAPFGALLAHRIDPSYLSRIFGILLIGVGMRLIGLF